MAEVKDVYGTASLSWQEGGTGELGVSIAREENFQGQIATLRHNVKPAAVMVNFPLMVVTIWQLFFESSPVDTKLAELMSRILPKAFSIKIGNLRGKVMCRMKWKWLASPPVFHQRLEISRAISLFWICMMVLFVLLGGFSKAAL